jgi:hypothetical protein
VASTFGDKKSSKPGILKISGLDTIVEKLVRYQHLMQWLKEFDTRKHYEIEMVRLYLLLIVNIEN